MQDFIIYQSKVALSLALLFLVWRLFLKNETFHKMNRAFLNFSVIFSFLAPFTKNFLQFSEQNQISSVILNQILVGSEIMAKSETNNFSFIKLFIIAYIIFSTVVFLSLVVKISRIIYLISIGKKWNYNNYKVISIQKDISPFAFLNTIFINEQNIEKDKLDNILYHESIHIKQKHTIDLLLLEIVTVIQWFNPFVYFYKQSLKTTHEYLSDEKVIEQGFDSDEYKLLLLKQKIGVQPGFANNFNKSLTLKRITMMNQKKSKSVAKLKVLFAIPVIAVSLVLFSFSTQNFGSEFVSSPTEAHDTIMPEYPGGDDALRAFIAQNVKYPEEAVKKGYEDNVFVRFKVSKNGTASDVSVVQGKYEVLNNEAIRVISSIEGYKPASVKGKKVEVYMTVPIKFKLSNDK